MTQTATAEPTMILDQLEVTGVEQISPHFVRIEFGGAALADFGVDGHLYDQRIKLVFPPTSGRLPQVPSGYDEAFAAWYALPEAERGHMRTYTVRQVRGEGIDTRLVVDFVLHLAEGATGPAASWAAAARPGDRVVVLAPRRGVAFGGIEFAPGDARQLLLVGDETAVPAISAILEQLPANAIGTAVLEVPADGDVLPVRHPSGVEVVWLPRGERQHGARLVDAVRDHFGASSAVESVPDEAIDPDLWETPVYSSSGEDVETPMAVGHDLAGLYAWIAGESKVVTTLRRFLVQELEIDRHQVAFMGYWRHGVSMK